MNKEQAAKPEPQTLRPRRKIKKKVFPGDSPSPTDNKKAAASKKKNTRLVIPPRLRRSTPELDAACAQQAEVLISLLLNEADGTKSRLPTTEGRLIWTDYTLDVCDLPPFHEIQDTVLSIVNSQIENDYRFHNKDFKIEICVLINGGGNNKMNSIYTVNDNSLLENIIARAADEARIKIHLGVRFVAKIKKPAMKFLSPVSGKAPVKMPGTAIAKPAPTTTAKPSGTPPCPTTPCLAWSHCARVCSAQRNTSCTSRPASPRSTTSRRAPSTSSAGPRGQGS